MTDINWSMVSAIAGIVAVLLVVIIEADRLFPRLGSIGLALTWIAAPALVSIIVIGILASLFPGFVLRYVSLFDVVLKIAFNVFVVSVILFSLSAAFFSLRAEPDPDWKYFFTGIVTAVIFGFIMYHIVINGINAPSYTLENILTR